MFDSGKVQSNLNFLGFTLHGYSSFCLEQQFNEGYHTFHLAPCLTALCNKEFIYTCRYISVFEYSDHRFDSVGADKIQFYPLHTNIIVAFRIVNSKRPLHQIIYKYFFMKVGHRRRSISAAWSIRLWVFDSDIVQLFFF